jgi:hypothetical protein
MRAAGLFGDVYQPRIGERDPAAHADREGRHPPALIPSRRNGKTLSSDGVIGPLSVQKR